MEGCDPRAIGCARVQQPQPRGRHAVEDHPEFLVGLGKTLDSQHIHACGERESRLPATVGPHVHKGARLRGRTQECQGLLKGRVERARASVCAAAEAGLACT